MYIRKIKLYLFLLLAISQVFARNTGINDRYPAVKGQPTGETVIYSPDPLVSYRWEDPKATDDLEVYTLQPVTIYSDNPSDTNLENISSIAVTGKCNLMFDFGQVNAAWFEFDSDDLEGQIEMSISEFNEPAVFNYGSQHPKKTAKPVKYGNTWRLELNNELYEGVRFAWIHINALDKPATIKDARLICQIKPTNYEGSFSCSDTMLNRIWYTAAYDVKLNLLHDHFGAILMERSDRHSWTGDAHVSQAASMVAFGNYDFVKTNLIYTSTQFNGIASYSLYWVLSLIDYYNYTEDKELLAEMLENTCAKLDTAYNHYGKNPKVSFMGWDERLGGGFENGECAENQYAYKMLSIRSWFDFSKIMRHAGYTELADKYNRYAEEKINELRKDDSWMSAYSIHAAADAVNAGFTTEQENKKIWETTFTDRLQRMSYSPFNQYFIIQSMARMNRYREALTTIDDCWGGQVRYGGTTFFEVFRSSWNDISNPNDAPVNNQCGYTSLCHPWSAGVTKWLNEEILGIKPLSPGFNTFIIKPQLSSSVTWVKGATPTLHGKIEASFDLNTGICEISVPPSTQATIGIPKAGLEIKNVTFAGKQYPASKEDHDFIYYTGLPEGHYQIRVLYAGELQSPVEEPLVYKYGSPHEDTSTKGNWKGKYGSKGYILCSYDSLENRSLIPAFMDEPVFLINRNEHWSTGTTDVRAPENPDGGTRNIGAHITLDPYACKQTMTIDLPCNKKETYKVSIYFVDWDTGERRSAIELFDLESKDLLAPVYMVRDYSGGKYVMYELNQPVRFRINQVRGGNAAISGIFFD